MHGGRKLSEAGSAVGLSFLICDIAQREVRLRLDTASSAGLGPSWGATFFQHAGPLGRRREHPSGGASAGEVAAWAALPLARPQPGLAVPDGPRLSLPLQVSVPSSSLCPCPLRLLRPRSD